MLAVAGGHVDAVSLLLEREANANMADNHGLTALHLGVNTCVCVCMCSTAFNHFQLHILLCP